MEWKPPIPEDCWNRIPPDVQMLLQAVLQQVERLQQHNQELRAENQHLRELLGRNSQNSSLPPSKDPPSVKRAPPSDPSGRRPGGQAGHARQQRPLLEPTLPPIALKPAQCRRCGGRLVGNDAQPLRHQVIELPPIQPEVREYQRHRLRCACCGATTCAPLPAGVPTGQYGPRLQATLALLAGAYRLSKPMIETLCADLLNVPICAGQVCALEADTAAATEAVVAPLRQYVRSQDAHIDETGWRHARRRAWLWAVVTTLVTVFHIARNRSGAVARDLLGPGYAHVASSDRYSAYNWIDVRRRQLCWAHLQRDFQAMVDRGGAGGPIGNELLCCAEELFARLARVRDGTLARSSWRAYMAELRRHVRTQLQLGSVCGCAKTAATCRELLKVEPALWTFVRQPDIEPTNNAAERALRHAVQWRKTSYGTQGETGRQFVQNVLTIVATCRQQGRNVLEFLTRCCQARLDHIAPPSLLPT